MQPSARATTAEQVADLLATLAAANGLVAAESDRISSSPAAVSMAALDRLTRLRNELRPGAQARAHLFELDPDLLPAGTSVWLARRRSATPPAQRCRPRGRPVWGAQRMSLSDVGVPGQQIDVVNGRTCTPAAASCQSQRSSRRFGNCANITHHRWRAPPRPWLRPTPNARISPPRRRSLTPPRAP